MYELTYFELSQLRPLDRNNVISSEEITKCFQRTFGLSCKEMEELNKRLMPDEKIG